MKRISGKLQISKGIKEKKEEVQILLSELKDKNNDGKKFLVIGKIQSGKTKFFTQLILQAIKKTNFDFTILLSGVTKALNKQTKDRLENHIKINREYDDIKIRDWGETFKGLKSDLVEKINWKKTVLSVIKNSPKLRQIKKLIKSFRGHRVLIVDDEADQASLNTRATREEISAVNSELTQIIKNLTSQDISFNYIGLTATPAGILFLEKKDLLSPDFSLLLKPAKDYVGLKEFCLPENENSRLIVVSDSNVNDWKYLHEVINTFLVGTVLSRTKMKFSEMLIHIDRKTSIHMEIHKEVNSHLKKLLYYSRKQSPYMAGGGWLEGQVKKGLSYYRSNWQNWTSEEKNKLLEVIGKLGAKVVNSKTLPEKTEIPHCIYIGGDIFKRGYSFQNLLVTFLTRRAKGLSYWDATAQNCRFLGYRLPYLEWMRVFVSNEVKKDLKETWEAEEEFLESFKEGELLLSKERTGEESINKIYLTKRMKPMREGVIPWEFVKSSFKVSQGIAHAVFFKQEKIYKDKSERIIETLDSEWDFYNKLQKDAKQSEFRRNIREFERDSIFLLKNYVGWEAYDQIMDKVSNYKNYKRKEIEQRIKSFFNTKANILLMRADRDISREAFGEDPKINIFSGEKKTKEENWEGDENIYKYLQNENKVLLYVYNYKILREEGESRGLFYALRFPSQVHETKSDPIPKDYYTSKNIKK